MENRKKIRFWPLLGAILGATVLLVLVYTAIVPRLTSRAFSDALCSSALLLALAAIAPVFLDMGRGFTIGGQMEGDEAERHAAMEKERQRREQGIIVTFSFAAATVIIVLLSLLIGLL